MDGHRHQRGFAHRSGSDGLGKLALDLGKSTTGALKGAARVAKRVGIVDGAIGGPESLAAVAALFPEGAFESVGPNWPDSPPAELDILIVAVDRSTVEEASRRLKAAPARTAIIVVLRDADVATTRRLSRDGAADVLPFPPSEPALAISLERLLARDRRQAGRDGEQQGEVVAFLKAGGGVGATAIATQVAVQLGAMGDDLVCLADLDVQFGAAALYLDLPEAMTVADLISLGQSLNATSFRTLFGAHRSGARVLAAPHDLMALEEVKAAHVDAMITGLRRDFQLTLVDLPSVWTAWTHRLLSHADRIVLVTHLSVPHIQLVKRQFRVLLTQGLEGRPVTLVCNSLASVEKASVSLKAAEHALGREFDVVIPEDRWTMTEAINQGVEISAIRRGTKVEKAIRELAGKVAPAHLAVAREGG